VMIAPQSLYYEAGVAMVSLILLIDLDRRAVSVAAGVWLSGWLYVVSESAVNAAVLVVAMTAVLGLAVILAMGRPERVAASP